MDGHAFEHIGQHLAYCAFDESLAVPAEQGGQHHNLHPVDMSHEGIDISQHAAGPWHEHGDDYAFAADHGVSPGDLPPEMNDPQGAQVPLTGPTILTGALMSGDNTSMLSGDVAYPLPIQEQVPEYQNTAAVWQQELQDFQAQQHQEHIQQEAWRTQQRSQSDPQWTFAMQTPGEVQLPLRPGSDSGPLALSQYTRKGVDDLRQQQLHPLGPFRSYDESNVAAAFQSQQQHQRQDSAGSNAAKVAIPKTGTLTATRNDSTPGSPQNTANAGMTAVRSGPMSREVQVQPRPRPGRKPMAGEDKEDRRRYQNRMAQRAFRDKRALKNVELEHEINRLKAEYQQHEADYRNTIAELRTSCQEKDRQNTELTETNTALEARVAKSDQRVAELERQLRLANSNIGSFRDTTGQPADQRPSSVPTPPESNYEIDFTNYGRTTSSTYGLRNSLSHDSDAMEFIGNEDSCGFCTDDQNCACKQEQQQRQRTKPTPIEPRVSATLPGSCDLCQSDPERARACRQMAAATRLAANTTPRTSSSYESRPSLTSTSMPPPRMSCSDMVDHFHKFGERTSSIGGLFGGRRLNAYPRESGGGYDLAEEEAAEVLTNIHRRSERATSTSSYADSQSGQSSALM